MSTDGSSRRRVVEAFLASDAPAMVADLAPDGIFHSPVADYHGHDRIGAVLSAVTQVITAPQPTRMLEGPGETALVFTAEMRDRRADGLLLATGEPDAPVSELTLMIRPLAALLDGVDRMKVLLGGSTPAQAEFTDLPGNEFVRRFEGAGYGSAVSFFLASPPPGGGPRLHRHPYEETFIVHEGRLTFTVDGEEIEAQAGQIVVAPPGAAHKFVNSGDGVARLTTIHPRAKMSQEDLD